MSDAIYRFEDIGEELAVPPLAALRALRLTGVLVSRSGWLQMPIEARQAVTNAGVADEVNTSWVGKVLSAAPMKELKMFPVVEDPNPNEVPNALANALGPGKSVPLPLWQAIRPVDRHVLVTLSQNTRLLHRLLDELAQRPSSPTVELPSSWTGLVAHCEVRMSLKTALALQSTEFMGGHALVLARVAGIRVARRADELVDDHAHSAVGPVELSASDRITGNSVATIWQAHVSTIGGEFSPSASLLAATTAATVTYNLAASIHRATMLVIANGRIIEEPWLAVRDEATRVGA